MNEKFTEKLKSSGLTMYRLSRMTGIPYTTINEIANGKKDINYRPADIVCRLAAALNTTMQEIMNPVHIMNQAEGKYRGIRYTWKYERTMHLHLTTENGDYIIPTNYQMTKPEYRRVYTAAAEMYIDRYLEERRMEEALQQFAAEEGAAHGRSLSVDA